MDIFHLLNLKLRNKNQLQQESIVLDEGFTINASFLRSYPFLASTPDWYDIPIQTGEKPKYFLILARYEADQLAFNPPAKKYDLAPFEYVLNGDLLKVMKGSLGIVLLGEADSIKVRRALDTNMNFQVFYGV
jgi:hypothetical protein